MQVLIAWRERLRSGNNSHTSSTNWSVWFLKWIGRWSRMFAAQLTQWSRSVVPVEATLSCWEWCWLDPLTLPSVAAVCKGCWKRWELPPAMASRVGCCNAQGKCWEVLRSTYRCCLSMPRIPSHACTWYPRIASSRHRVRFVMISRICYNGVQFTQGFGRLMNN